MTAKSVQPIFVVGKHRSGTTWVANILSAHPMIMCAEHKYHQGQHESAYFSALAPYCNWGRTEQDRIALRAIFEASDYYRLLKLSPSTDIDIESLSIEDYFRAIMDEATVGNGCSHWVEKTPAHTLYLDCLIESYPDARIVAVKRDIHDVVRSCVYRAGDPRSIASWAFHAGSYGLYENMLLTYADSVYWVEYAGLKGDYESEVEQLLEYVGVAASEQGPSVYNADSAYTNGIPRTEWKYKTATSIVYRLIRALPKRGVVRLIRYMRERKVKKLPPWFFRIFRGRQWPYTVSDDDREK